PTGDAVEGRRLLDPRERAQMRVRQRRRRLDEAADPQLPGGRVEGRHVIRHGVDAPALRGEDRRDVTGHGRDDAGHVAPRGLAPGERREPSGNGHEEEAATVTARLRLVRHDPIVGLGGYAVLKLGGWTGSSAGRSSPRSWGRLSRSSTARWSAWPF